MASTYVNDLRLNELATGDGAGTWGTTTNTNLELIGEAFSYGTPSSATLGATTTAFTTTGQASGTNYTSGGSALTNVTPSATGTTAVTDFNDLTFSTATITARGCMIYNDTNGDKSVATIDFGGDKTSTAGDFTVVFPAKAASTAIIRIA